MFASAKTLAVILALGNGRDGGESTVLAVEPMGTRIAYKCVTMF
jgi:hypothetical protein